MRDTHILLNTTPTLVAVPASSFVLRFFLASGCSSLCACVDHAFGYVLRNHLLQSRSVDALDDLELFACEAEKGSMANSLQAFECTTHRTRSLDARTLLAARTAFKAQKVRLGCRPELCELFHKLRINLPSVETQVEAFVGSTAVKYEGELDCLKPASGSKAPLQRRAGRGWETQGGSLPSKT